MSDPKTADTLTVAERNAIEEAKPARRFAAALDAYRETCRGVPEEEAVRVILAAADAVQPPLWIRHVENPPFRLDDEEMESENG